MQTRLLVFFGLFGALAGLALLLVLLFRPEPKPELTTTEAPLREVVSMPPPTQEASKQAGTLLGKVIDGSTEQPLPGATILPVRPDLSPRRRGESVPLWGIMTEEASRRTVSGPDGTFAIEDLPPDYWNLWVERKGYAFASVARARFSETHTIRLYPAAEIRGRVLFPDGTPAPDVRIEYTPQGTLSQVFQYFRRDLYKRTTGGDGRFEITDLPPGLFTVEVYADGYLPAPWTAEPPLQYGTVRDLGTKRLDGGFGLVARVLWRGTNEPVEGIEVKAIPINDPLPRTSTGLTRRTDAKGIARFNGLGGQVLEEPRFQVTVLDWNSGVIMPDDVRLYAPGEEVVFHLRRTGIVKGKVLEPDGKPVERFFVRLEEKSGDLQHQRSAFGAKGEFRVPDVREGSYRLVAIYAPYQDEVLDPVEVGQDREVDVGTITLRPGAEIAGTVRLSSGRALQRSVVVHLGRKVGQGWDVVRRAHCSADGSYRLTGVPAGSFFLWPESDSRTTDPVAVEMEAGRGFAQVDLTVYGEGFLEFHCFDEVEGRAVRVSPPPILLLEEGRAGEFAWMGDGHALRPGSYEATALLPGPDGEPERRSLGRHAVKEGERTGPITIRLDELRHDREKASGR
ncbi:MAG: carboxypeptidase regulatory-like domain-containing protein [Planctomycetaceae bacterium]